MATPVLRLAGLGKRFGEAAVLTGVDLTVAAGEVVGLLGENGAGKSTLMNIVSGGLRADAGDIEVCDVAGGFGSIAEGIAAGVSFVHQELSIVGSLDVSENLFLGRMPTRRGMVDRRAMRREAHAMLAAVGAGHIPVGAAAGSLRVGEQQLIEIARAAARKPRLLILDEPTSSLTPHEVAAFKDFVRRAKAEGAAIIFITHRLEEALTLCDRLVVLRNGVIVSDAPPTTTSREKLIADMTGKPSLFAHVDRVVPPAPDLLALTGVSDGHLLDDVTLGVRPGEILGLFGLVGAGRTELLETIAGARRPKSGTMTLAGPYAPSSPNAARTAGVALVPEGRKTAGILPQHSVRRNASASCLARFAEGGFVSGAAERRVVGEALANVRVKMARDTLPITALSGGNQQKVIFARALLARPRLLLLDEPTHGVDVGAKEEIYAIVRRAADDGLAVIVASSEIPEIRALCDRVAVLSKGRVAAVFERAEMNEGRLLAAAFSGHEARPAA